MSLAKFVTANGDSPFEPGAVLETAVNQFGKINFVREGNRFAQWLAWNSTSDFIRGLKQELEAEIESMNEDCEDLESSSLTNVEGFPLDSQYDTVV